MQDRLLPLLESNDDLSPRRGRANRSGANGPAGSGSSRPRSTPSDFHLDEKTRELGRQGVAAARAVLRHAVAEAA